VRPGERAGNPNQDEKKGQVVIHVTNRSRQDVPIEKLVSAAGAALAAEDSAHLDLSIAVVTDAEIHLLNRSYLKHDYPTDVISFPLREGSDPDPLLGEVIVSADRARHEARQRGLAFEDELARYVVHGTLHLLGYDDREAEKRERMHARQEEILRKLGGTKAAKPGLARVKAEPEAKPAKGPKGAAGPSPSKVEGPAPSRVEGPAPSKVEGTARSRAGAAKAKKKPGAAKPAAGARKPASRPHGARARPVQKAKAKAKKKAQAKAAGKGAKAAKRKR
jgi:probable rRNA maturation factor